LSRQAPGQFGHGVGRRRGNDQEVGGVGQPDVRDVGGQSSPAGMPEVGVDRSARQRLKGQWGDEAGRRLGHHHVHLRPHLGQVAGQGADLVDGDAAGDAQENALLAQQRDGFHVAPFTIGVRYRPRGRRSCRLKSPSQGLWPTVGLRRPPPANRIVSQIEQMATAADKSCKSCHSLETGQ
jgi:hypothetical protein